MIFKKNRTKGKCGKHEWNITFGREYGGAIHDEPHVVEYRRDGGFEIWGEYDLKALRRAEKQKEPVNVRPYIALTGLELEKTCNYIEKWLSGFHDQYGDCTPTKEIVAYTWRLKPWVIQLRVQFKE